MNKKEIAEKILIGIAFLYGLYIIYTFLFEGIEIDENGNWGCS